MVVAGASVADDLRRLARLVADFHARAAANGDIARQGGRAAVRGRWIANLREIDRVRRGEGPLAAGLIRATIGQAGGRGVTFGPVSASDMRRAW